MNKEEQVIYEEVIRSNFMMSLAVSNDDIPQICTAFYVTSDNKTFYFKSRTESEHSTILETNNKAAISIYHPSSNYSKKSGIQALGYVERVRNKAEMVKAVGLYGKAFAGAEKKFVAIPELISDFVKSTMYKFIAQQVKVVDSSKGIHSLKYLVV